MESGLFQNSMSTPKFEERCTRLESPWSNKCGELPVGTARIYKSGVPMCVVIEFAQRKTLIPPMKEMRCHVSRAGFLSKQN